MAPARFGWWLPAAIVALAATLLAPTVSLGQHSEGHYFDLLARGLDWPAFLRACWPASADVFIRPLAFMSWKLNAALGGDRAYHLVNIGLHLISILLLYRLARVWSGSSSFGAAAASLYGLFPAHATTVGWVVARFDLLAIGATLAALLLQQRIVDGHGRLPQATAVVLLFGAGLLCKESTAALPAALSAWPLLQTRPAVERRLALAASGAAWALLLLYLAFRLAILDHPWGYAHTGWTLPVAAWLRDFGAALAANLILPCTALRLGSIGPPAAALLVVAVLGLSAGGRAPRVALAAALVLLAVGLAPVGANVYWALTENDWYYLSAPAVGIAWLVATPLLARRAPARRLAAGLVALLTLVYAAELRAQVGAWGRAALRVSELAERIAPPAGTTAVPAAYVFGPPIRFPWVVGVNLLTTKLRATAPAAARSYPGGAGLMNSDRLAWLHQLPPYRSYTENGLPGIDRIPDRLIISELGGRDAVWLWDARRLELVELSAVLRQRLESSQARSGTIVAQPAAPVRVNARTSALSIAPTPALAVASIAFQLDSPLEPGQRGELLWHAAGQRHWGRIGFEIRGGSASSSVRLFPQRCLSWALQDRPITDLRLGLATGQRVERFALESAAAERPQAAVLSPLCPDPLAPGGSDIF